jgi:hypothetical protein
MAKPLSGILRMRFAIGRYNRSRTRSGTHLGDKEELGNFRASLHGAHHSVRSEMLEMRGHGNNEFYHFSLNPKRFWYTPTPHQTERP